MGRNAELEKVELQYKLGGFEYTTQAYKTVDTTTGGDYVVYLPNVVESVHDLIATAMSTYANVNFTYGGNTTKPHRHESNYCKETGEELALDSVNETTLTITVQSSENYYNGKSKTYTLHIIPVDLKVVKAEFNEKLNAPEIKYNLANIPEDTTEDSVTHVRDNPNTFDGKIQAVATPNELLAISLKSEAADGETRAPGSVRRHGAVRLYQEAR